MFGLSLVGTVPLQDQNFVLDALICMCKASQYMDIALIRSCSYDGELPTTKTSSAYSMSVIPAPGTEV